LVSAHPVAYSPAMDASLEDRIRTEHAAGALREAATVALEGYGAEILGFLVAILRDENAAREIFSTFCEDVWVGLPRFQWRSSFRTWAYALARHAADRHRRSPEQRRRVPLDDHVSVLAAQVWRSTRTELRSRARDRVAALRETLDPDEQALLVLRIDRSMSWDEIVTAMETPGAALEPEEQRRRSAALRKRFERIKADLRDRAIAEGLVPDPASGSTAQERGRGRR
jgi:RNA polymerase sigma-70 factor, ECF subfamily